MNELIKEVTSEGGLTLNPKKLHALLELLPSNESMAFEILQNLFVKKKHAQVRYSATLLLDALLRASPVILDLVSDSLQDLVRILVDEWKTLKPRSWAPKAYRLALTCLKDWARDFGNSKRPFAIAYRYLTEDKKIDFDHLHFERPSVEETQRLEKSKALKRAKYLQVCMDAGEKEPEIIETIGRLEACLGILLPDILPGLEEGEEKASSKNVSYVDTLQAYGLGSRAYALEITVNKDSSLPVVQETDDNSVVFDELRECSKLIERKHLVLVSTWVKLTSQAEVEEARQKDYETFLKRMIALKERLHQGLTQAQDILQDRTLEKTILPDAALEDDSDLSDEEFIEADNAQPKEIKQNFTGEDDNEPRHISAETKNDFRLLNKKNESPSDDQESISLQSEDPGSSLDPKKKDLFSQAPLVEYAEDLDYWDKASVPFNHSGLEFQHRFLGAGTGERHLSEETLSELRKRTVALPPHSLPKDIRICGAPLKTGGLCQRRDLERCPIHGQIVERDATGVAPNTQQPTGPSLAIPDWERLAGSIEALHGPAPGHSKRQLESMKEPTTAKKRISKRLARNKTERAEQDVLEFQYKMRDRQAFKW